MKILEKKIPFSMLSLRLVAQCVVLHLYSVATGLLTVREGCEGSDRNFNY